MSALLVLIRIFFSTDFRIISCRSEECRFIFGAVPKKKVQQFAELLLEVGAQGIILSPQELGWLGRFKAFSRLLKITPGVRPAWALPGDQKRLMTPAEAILAGADCLVIGSPITRPPRVIGRPADAAQHIAQEIAKALNLKKENANE